MNPLQWELALMQLKRQLHQNSKRLIESMYHAQTVEAEVTMSIDQRVFSSENQSAAITVTGLAPYQHCGQVGANGIGDIHSTEKGSGARFNAGKLPADLLPIRVATQLMREVVSIDTSFQAAPVWLEEAYELLGRFQETHDPKYLAELISAVYTEAEFGTYPLRDAARVFEYGKRKYAAWNWAKGMPWSVPVACIFRHLSELEDGAELDHESGLSIRGHIMCNVLMLRTFVDTYPEGNDLPTTLLPS